MRKNRILFRFFFRTKWDILKKRERRESTAADDTEINKHFKKVKPADISNRSSSKKPNFEFAQLRISYLRFYIYFNSFEGSSHIFYLLRSS